MRIRSGAVMLNHLLRYAPVVRLVREVPPGPVLEVGSGDEGLATMLGPERPVTAVDVAFGGGGAGERVEADARALPFPDRSFDVVVALDMLEHVAPADRPAVLDELARVTRRRLIVGCPTGPRALESDRALARMLDRRGETYAGSWLEEHLAHGFPEGRELEAALRRHGAPRLLANENVHTHELVMRTEMTRRPRKVADLVTRVLAPALRLPRPGWRRFPIAALRGFDRGIAYRTIAVLDR